METSEKFDNLVFKKLKVAEETVKQNAVNFDDAPEEFLDPLTYNIMENPVILPSSKINIDRRTIEDYLLANPSDPFNRNPLTKEELIPNNELKKRIDEYKINKIKEKQKNKINKDTNSKENSTKNEENNIKNNDENKTEDKIEQNKEVKK